MPRFHPCFLLCTFIGLLIFAPLHAESLRLLGRTAFPSGTKIGKTTLGGLSGISYDPATKTFWAVSDDSSYRGGPPRAYQLKIDLTSDGQIEATVVSTLTLRDTNGRPFAVADCEGIAATGRGGVWITSEGRAGKKGALPFIKLFSLKNGATLRTLPVPAVYLPTDAAGTITPLGDVTQVAGVLNNKSLESCALTPDLRTLFTGSETSLLQEKAPGESDGGASLLNITQVRISALETKTGRLLGQRLYQSDAGCLFGSISELVSLDNEGSLYVLERRVIRLQDGTGSCGIRIYRVSFFEKNATDLRKTPAVRKFNVQPLTKTLVYDSKKAGIDDLDNLEGMGLFPLPNGRKGLIAVSDDNFSKRQETQILVYEILP